MSLGAILAALVIAGLAVAGAGYGGYQHGVTTAEARCEAAKVAPLEKSIEIKTQRDAAGDKALTRSAVRVARVEGTYKQLEQEVQRHVETHPELALCGLGPDGLRQWRAANAGDPAEPAAGTSDAAVPGIAAAPVGDSGPSAAEPRPDDGDASPGLRAAGRPAGLDSIPTAGGDSR